MDGLEIKEVRASSIFLDNRLDSEYVSKNYLMLQTALERIKVRAIGEFAFVTDGIHESIVFDENSKINLLSAKAPKNNYFDLSGTGFISAVQNADNPRTQLQENDVIISTVGTIGNCAVVNKRILPANADRHVGIIRILNSEIKPRFLSTFLLSKYGRSQSKRFTTGNVQPNLFLYKIKDIKVPLLSIDFQCAIERIILHTETLFASSENGMQHAEDSLLHFFDDVSLENKPFSIKTLSDSLKRSGRLDAEYYQPKYEVIDNSLRKLKHTTLKDLATISSGEFIEEGYYGEKGTDYIRGTDITELIVDEDPIKVNVDHSSFKTIGYDDLAFAMIGSVGKVAINKSHQRGIVSNNLGTISLFDKRLSPYVLLFLTSKIGQSLFEKYRTRTAQPKIKKGDIGNFMIPILDEKDMIQLSEQVEDSLRLRMEAKQLLNKAIKAVEMAIETDEATALSWLEQYGQSIQ